MKIEYAHIRNESHHTTKSFRLKHWFNKRVNVFGRYGKIAGKRLDRDMNFIYWLVKFPNSILMPLPDPNFNQNKTLDEILLVRLWKTIKS